MTKLAKFNAAEYVDSDEVIAEYLNATLEDEDPNVLLAVIGDIAKARGMTKCSTSNTNSLKHMFSGLGKTYRVL